MKKTLAVLFSLLLAVGVVNAQDPQYSQYYNAPLLLNPGFAGATAAHRIILNHRLQWPSLPQAYSTYALSYDLFRPELKSGFGFVFNTDKAGSAAYRNTLASVYYSYKLQVADKWVITPGLYFGYGYSSIDIEKLLFGDQLEFDNGGTPSLDPALLRLGSRSYFDTGVGFLMYSSKYWFGTSVYHLNQPNVSILEGDASLPMKWQIHAGARVPLNGAMRYNPNPQFLVFSINASKQGPIEQLITGVNYVVDPITVGVWYRGIPFRSTQQEPPAGSGIPISSINPSSDAVIFLMQLALSNFQFGYSFDFTLSSLSVDTGGAHEISLIYEFEIRRPRRVKRRNKLIPCPTFNTGGKGLNPFKKK